MQALIAVGIVSTASASWESARFIEADGVTNHVSITGKARSWEGQQGQPRLRLSCETSYGGGELHLGFYFPAGHRFPQQSSKNEPVSFRFKHADEQLDSPGSNTIERVEYLFKSSETVFYTTLASDGLVTSYSTGKLVLDLLGSDYLDVYFMQTTQRYHVQYSLEGFAASAQAAMQACQLGGLDTRDIRNNWQDNGIPFIASVVKLKAEPPYGAAEAVTDTAQ